MRSWIRRPLTGLATALSLSASLWALPGPQVDPELGLPAMAGEEKVMVDTARFAPATARPGELATLEIEIVIVAGWHIYGAMEENGEPPVIRVDEAGGLEAYGASDIPPGEPHDAFGITSHWVMGVATLEQQMLIPAGTEPGEIAVLGAIEYTACNDQFCDPVAEAAFRATLTVEAGEPRPERMPTGTPPAREPPPAGGTDTEAGAASSGSNDDLSTMPLSLFLLAAIGWGLFALAMPCTYPMIPITISFFTKQASTRGGHVLPLALAYGFGIVLMFVLIGVTIGQAIVPFATHAITNLVIAALFLIFALVLFGLINLQPPQFLMNFASQASSRGGFAGVFLMGATLVITSFTCTAPFVGTLLAIGAEGGGIGRVVLGMAVFGATMAVPFVLLSLVPGKLQALPRSGEWMNTLKVFLGFIEVAAALKFLSNADLFWSWGWLSRELFLWLWAGIFIISGMFLLGQIRLKGETGEIGPGRLTGALAILLLAIYCLYGASGNRMDWVMTSIIPNYSNRLNAGESGDETIVRSADGRIHVIDDYDTARVLALAERRMLMLNFTGVT